MKTALRLSILLLAAALLFPFLTSQARAQGSWVYFEAPAKARLRIENNTDKHVRVYAISRHGRWMWAADVKSGDRAALSTPVGQRWVLTDWRGGKVIRSITAEPGTTTVAVGRDRPEGLFPSQVGVITFKNRRENAVHIYKVNPVGVWFWECALKPGKSIDVRSMPGQAWVVTNLRGNIVTSVPGTSREREIVLRD